MSMHANLTPAEERIIVEKPLLYEAIGFLRGAGRPELAETVVDLYRLIEHERRDARKERSKIWHALHDAELTFKKLREVMP